VRSRAAEWKVDPARLGALGFSAGAIITLELALGDEKIVRPAFVGVIYGPLGARNVPADAPPMFTALGAGPSNQQRPANCV
jgi:acetyl esterase/lipase